MILFKHEKKDIADYIYPTGLLVVYDLPSYSIYNTIRIEEISTINKFVTQYHFSGLSLGKPIRTLKKYDYR